MDIYAVIGAPIHHSMSPQMHNQQIESLKLDAKYVPFLIEPDDLADGIRGLRALHVKGFNVTLPHKEAIMPLLDEIEPCAKAIGAVNTVIREGNRLIGTNTDCSGFTASLKEKGVQISDQSILVLGAGGAARAIVYGLLEEGANLVTIANRTPARAQEMADDFALYGKVEARTVAEVMKESIKYDMIVNTTSVGMYPNLADTPFSNAKFKKGCVVVDIIYNPFQTAFLQSAAAQGCVTMNGLGMFVHQGAIAFQRWTGLDPNFREMEETVCKCLEGKK